MTTDDLDRADPAALAAIRLRRRLRALTAGQAEAFDLLCYQLGTGSALGATIGHAASRLPYLAALLADVAWTHGGRTTARARRRRRRPRRSSGCSAPTPTSGAAWS